MVLPRRYPLTAYQRDIWTAELYAPGTSQFNAVMCERFEGEVDVEALRSALGRVLRANDAFRLRFDDADGTPVQWLADEEPVGETARIPVVDFSAGPDPAAASSAWLGRTLVRGFALRNAPLFEATLLKESDSVVTLHLKAHHLLVDGWALNQLSHQISADYQQIGQVAEGQEPTAPAGAPSSLAALEDEARYRASDAYEQGRAHYRETLATLTPALFGRKRKSGERPSSATSFTIPGEVVERIKQGGNSPFAYIAAALGAYLSRVHRTEEAVIGIPLLNRRTDEEKATVAEFANTLPLRIRTAPGQTLREVATDVRSATRELQKYERFPLGDALREMPVGESGSRQLFDVTLSYLRYPRPAALDGIRRDVAFIAQPHDQEALAVVVRALEDSADLQVDLNYARDVFDADNPAEALAGHLQALLVGGLDQAAPPAGELPLLSAAEREKVTAFGTGPLVPYASGKTLHALFEERAALVPDQVAVYAADGEDSLTYAELDARSNQVAHALRERGVRPDDRVAVLLERGPRMFVAVLGVLKSGGAYVPVDPGYPAERIAYLLSDSRAKVVLTGPAGGPTDATQPTVVLDSLLTGPTAPPEPVATSRNLAYVIYTSGSTGRPKGAMVEHHSVVNRLAWMQRGYPIGENDVILQKTPISFDVSVWELFWWGVEGAASALLPVGGEKDPQEILRTIAERRVSVMHFVPSMLGPFLELLDNKPELLDDAASLHTVFCSGEALTPSVVEQFAEVFARADRPAPRLVNLYGPTEATVDVSYYDCPTEPGQPVGRIPIGRPVDNTRLRILSADGSLQPVGVPGELCIGGVQVARGYLDRPELTAEKFIQDPYGNDEDDESTGRLYRTGDLARWLADGTVEYLGRIDGQVKIRGNRVELGEVQDTLARVPGVRAAVVIDHTTPARGTFLAGYYVADDSTGADLDPAVLRTQLLRTLPEFMVPTHFLRIDAIPLTPNGKADRRALPAPNAAAHQAAPDQGPRNATEEALAAIWRDVLQTDRVSVHDDYFALGGDSILSLRIRAGAEARGIRFSLTDLVQNPTVARLAALATVASEPAEPEPDLPPFALVSSVDRGRLEGAEDAYPLTRLQLGLLYHSRQHETSAVYKDVFQYTLRIGWDEAAFRRAFDRLVARHPVLRSSFDLAGFSEPLQIIHAQAHGGLEIADLREYDEETAAAAVRAHIDERRYHPYTFEQAPLHLFRAHLRPDTVELVFSFHHAILDGGSVANLLSELLQDYAHHLGAGIGPVAEGTFPSAVHHVREERSSLASAADAAYWRQKLDGAEALRLDAFRPAEPPRGDAQVVHHVDVPEALNRDVRAFARTHAVPLKSVLFAAHCLTLRMFTGAGDLITGLVTHGRPEQDGGERTVGLFLNTMPVRAAAAPQTWLETVRELFRQEQESHPHRRYPLSAIQEDRGGDTVVETAFNYVHFHQLAEVLDLPDVALESFRTWEETNFQLLVNAISDPTDESIRLRIDGDGRSLTPAQAALYADAYTGILRRVVEHPDEKPDFAFLAPAPEQRADDVADSAYTDVVRLFDDTVARTPESVALVFHEQHLTYRELDRWAGRVARRLVSLGARPGDLVGIAMDRSPEAVAVTLGIAKAGAAAVPLDTGYPQERLTSMLDQAEPFRVVAQAAHAHLIADASLLLPAEELFADGAEGDDGDRDVELPAVLAADTTAYVLFTSGSTGAPKGVAMPHRSLANLIAWQNSVDSGAVGARTLQYAPLSFDVSFQELYSTLCSGGTLHIVTEAERRDMPGLLRLIDTAGVERVFLPYVALQQLAETADSLSIAPRALRVLISSGEQLRVTDEIRRLCAALPGMILENQYGPTESHVVTRYSMTGDPAGFPALPPIGTAIDGALAVVLDARMRPTPPGVKGEIHLGGAALADGYLGRPDLTDERFVPHPTLPGERLYRTGDLGFTLPGGEIVCVGRADSQVKVRGFRVEPAEVELAITALVSDHPGIREAAVVARRRDGNDAFLAAFLVGDPERADLTRLREQLRSTLPEFMTPSHIEWLDALPWTPSGKRDDAALRRVPLTAAASRDTTEPRDAYERGLVEILRDLLQVPQLGVHDNVFDLGATSLTAMRFVVSVEQRYGVGIPLSGFIAAPTVAGLAERLRSGDATATFEPLVPIRPGGDRPPMFLVHPMGGNVLCYVPFAKHLPEDQPLYAFQAVGSDPGTEPLGSVEEIAASYIAAMRKQQPEGPYTIGGWSFGGFAAFEMARQLQDAGQEVSSMIMLDTVALNQGRRETYSDEGLLAWFFWELLWLSRGGDSPMEVIPEELTTLDEKFDFIAQLSVDEGVLPAGSNGSIVRRLFKVYAANWQATAAYRPDKRELDFTLIRATEPLPEVLRSMHGAIGSLHADPANGWRALTSGVLDVVAVPGDHLTIMEEPYVELVAKTVADIADAAGSARNTDTRNTENGGK
ncbi:amino acid adenylation domain-containing protein [Streptomyces sp. NPDC021093]|uniref:amino acid adenylation domain-containing protein n=1 Tax=Streptomyces sp. NPDC021093 TaxID=3365112 RepID=UPI0037980DBE